MGEYSLTFHHTSKSNFKITQNTRLPLMEYFGSDGKFNRHSTHIFSTEQYYKLAAFYRTFYKPRLAVVGLCGYLLSVNKEVMTKS